MVTKVTYIRNPYPLPPVSPQEGSWIQRGPDLGAKVSVSDRNWDLKVNPYERLYAHHTLNSIRKHCRYHCPQVPINSLDILLTAEYNHEKDLMVPKEYVCMQAESLGKETWRVLRNEIKIGMGMGNGMGMGMGNGQSEEHDKFSLLKDQPICYRGPTEERRNHPSNVKLGIEGPHRDQSNPGYSRKIDGTLYGI